MVSVFAAEAGPALLPSETILNGSSYAMNRKADWDRNDFSSLFEQHLFGGRGNAPDDGEALRLPRTAADAPADSSDGSPPDSSAAPRSGNDLPGPAPAISASAEAASDMVAISRESTGTGVAQTVPNDPWAIEDGSSQSNDVSSLPIRATGESEVFTTGPRITTQLDGDAVNIWIRDAATTDTNVPALLTDIRAQLSWRGLTLASLTINGRFVTSPCDSRAAPDAMTSVSREQEYVR